MLELNFDSQACHDAAQGMWHIQAKKCNCYRRCKSPEAARQRCLEQCPAVLICQGFVPSGGKSERHRRTMFWQDFAAHTNNDYQYRLMEVPLVAKKRVANPASKEKVLPKTESDTSQTDFEF